MIFAASVFEDLSISETYKRFKEETEFDLAEERESDLYKYMKMHRIYNKTLAKWMMNRSRNSGSSGEVVL
ncbi:unnamed protein product [Gongylonema pulchrum]|uniref:Uncharacterized protein n=1 Tax=Gongylonema pulchrum TaxID=637853 RepID=A0A183D862_9BILA|nr:unnamed protein product [Gongylonema pulchrum]